MSGFDLLDALTARGVRLWVDGDRLRYRAPEGLMTPELRTQLAREKARLIDLLSRVVLGPAGSMPRAVAVPAERYQPFPLTDIQQAYVIGRSRAIELGNIGCHGYIEIDRPDFDWPRARRAFQRLIDHHDMLRTVMAPDDDTQQVLASVPPYEPGHVDIRSWPPEARDEHLAQVRRELSHQVFDPCRWPLFEIRATRLSDTMTRLHLSLDTLIGDAMTVLLIVRDWARLSETEGLVLRPLEFSFRDYVIAERVWRASEQHAQSLTYWHARLETMATGPALPARVSPASIERPTFTRRQMRLDAEAWQQLKERALCRGLTASVVLVTAFSDVLALWSNADHFTLTLTMFNRLPVHPDIKDIAGEFTSTILLEVMNRAPSFEARAQALGARLWEDLEHAGVSGVHLVRELARRTGSRGRPLLPVVFTSLLVQSDLTRQADSLDWLDGLVYGISQTPQVSIDHQVFERRGALHVSWDVVDDLFPPGVIDAMFDTFVGHIHRLANEEPSWQSTGRLPLPPSMIAARARANATAHPVMPLIDETLDRLVARAVERHPDAAAVVTASGRTLSYRELWSRSAAVAEALSARGVARDELVAIVMKKGWEQVVGTVGIVRSGAAYLPIDADWPASRVAYLLADGRVRIALTQTTAAGVLPAGVDVLNVDALGTAPDGARDPAPIAAPADLAYVIYTSGSTGQPKGVPIEHRSAVNTIVDVNERFQVDAGDRVLGLSNLTFDLSVYDIFGTLAAGATLMLPDVDEVRDLAQWAGWAASEGVTIWNSVPAWLSLFCAYADGRPELQLPALRLALLSGDWIPLPLPDRIRALAPACEVVSLGGATEVSIWSIWYPIGAIDPAWSSIPYGRPMRNQTWYVLDAALHPCPDWVAGDLYIGGVGLARGYWHDEARTAAQFIRHPSTAERLYKTGDLGRFHPDGTIEFLGRNDLQVKVHGHRIELGEIEASLGDSDTVREAVVIAERSADGGRQLVAYVVPAPAADAAAASERLKTEWRAHLLARLPPYMVPMAFEVIDALPLGANGKVDRSALERSTRPERPKIAPRTSTEVTLAAIWCDVLKRPEIGVDDNFFELGGHSLMAMQIAARIRGEMAVDVSLRTMFESPTIAALADAIEHQRRDAVAPTITPIPRAARNQPVPLTFAQEAIWRLDRQLAGGRAFCNSLVAARVDGPIDVARMEHSLATVFARHESLRTTFHESDGEPVQIVHAAVRMSVDVVDFEDLPVDVAEARARQLLLDDTRVVFDLERWPLFRVHVIRIREQLHMLAIVMHHIIMDDWAARVFIRDLQTIYLLGSDDTLPELPIQLPDFAIWQRRVFDDARLARSVTELADRLRRLPRLQIPYDRPRPSPPTNRLAREPFALTPESMAAVYCVSRSESVTPFVVLLAAFAAVLRARSGQAHLVVDEVVFARSRMEVDGLVGVFADMVPLHIDTVDDSTFRDLVGSAREAVLDADARQALPYPKLLEALDMKGERYPYASSVSPILFNHRGRFVDEAAAVMPVTPIIDLESLHSEIFCDLRVIQQETDDGLIGVFDYSVDVFEAATMREIVAEYCAVLDFALAELDVPLAQLPCAQLL